MEVIEVVQSQSDSSRGKIESLQLKTSFVWKYMLWEECKDERDGYSGVVGSRHRRCMWEIWKCGSMGCYDQKSGVERKVVGAEQGL